MTESQNEQILTHMLDGHSITPIEALQGYGCFRLGARIFELRGRGYQIDTTIEVDEMTGKRFACYSMNAEERARHT